MYLKDFVLFAMLILCVFVDAKKSKQEEKRNKANNKNANTNATLDKLETVADYEAYARTVLSPEAINFFYNGSLSQNTLRENIKAFTRLRFRPKLLVDVSERIMWTELQGTKISMPLALSPTNIQRLASDKGEIDTARAACKANTIFIMGALASVTLEDVAAAAPGCPIWQNVYIFTNRTITADLVRRAEINHFKAIVVTIDEPSPGRRLEKSFLKLPEDVYYANVQKYLPPGQKEFGPQVAFDSSLTWKDLAWLQSITKLPIIAKGILTAEAALTAVKYGVQGVFVSNHGGRQLDNDPASIEALPEVVDAIGDSNVDIYMDGGIRTGSDILMALALGAKACFIGRPYLYGLAAGGKQGVTRILERLRSELDLNMELAGVQNIRAIPDRLVVNEKYYKGIAPPPDKKK